MIVINVPMPKGCDSCVSDNDRHECLADYKNRSVWKYCLDNSKPDWCPLIDVSPKLADNLVVYHCPVHPMLGGGTVPTYTFNCPKCGKEHFGINKSYLDTHDFFCDACGQQIIFKEEEVLNE